MKKRLLKIISVSIIMTLIMSICASAVTPRWTYLFSVRPDIDKTNDTYGVTVTADPSIASITADLVLYKKGLLGIYTKKSTHTETIYTYSGIINGSYDMDLDNEYKVVATVTVKTASGQSETATAELAV